MTKHLRKARAPYDAPEYRRMRGPNGRRLCRWCLAEVPPRRQTWCSKTCVEQYVALTSTSRARRFLIKRDGPCCALCGDDVVAGQKLVRAMYLHIPEIGPILREELAAAGFKKRGAMFEVDHATPLVEGGRHALENLRLLCRPCHLAQTKALAARRATRRRECGTA